MQINNSPKIVYLLERFPVLSETFIRQEVLILEHQGLLSQLFSLSEPSANNSAQSEWNGRTPLTYISHQSKLKLLTIAVRRFFKSPIRFLYAAILMAIYELPQSAIKYLISGAYVAEQIEHLGVTHIHAHFASASTSVAQVVYLLTGIPYSFTAHAYDIYLSRKSSLSFKMSMACFVATCSAYNKHYLEELIDRRKSISIHCIYLGIDLGRFPSHNAISHMPGTVPLILAVSRLVEKKGLLYLITACRILKDQGYNFICHIVGDGPQRAILEKQVRELDLTDTVKLLGAKSHEQVIEMYQQATIVTLPCIVAQDGDRDGIPIALVEALYMGVPVISTPVSGIPELISQEENGLLVPPQDSIALAASLTRLLENSLLRSRLVHAGRETVLEQFDMAKNVQRLISLFEQPQKIDGQYQEVDFMSERLNNQQNNLTRS